MPARVTTSIHMARSLAMKAANSCAEPIRTSAPSLPSAATSSADLRLSLIAALSLATMVAGVPAGATTPVNVSATKSGMPPSIMVGKSGGGIACCARDAERADFPRAHERQQARHLSEQDVHLTGDDAGDRFGGALVGDVDEVGSGLQFEQFRGEGGQVAVAHGAEVELAGTSLGIGDELLDVLRGEVGCDHEHLIALGDLRDRREVLYGVVIAKGDRRSHHQGAGVAEQQRVAVGLGARDRFGAERAAGAGAILDDHGLPKDRPKALNHEARRGVDGPPGGYGTTILISRSG